MSDKVKYRPCINRYPYVQTYIDIYIYILKLCETHNFQTEFEFKLTLLWLKNKCIIAKLISYYTFSKSINSKALQIRLSSGSSTLNLLIGENIQNYILFLLTMIVHTVVYTVCSILGYLMFAVTTCQSLGLSWAVKVPGNQSSSYCTNHVDVVGPQQMFIWVMLHRWISLAHFLFHPMEFVINKCNVVVILL